jgi:hypothetical protein
VTISSGASESAASPNLNDFGDYTGLAFEGGSFYPIWADNSRELNGNPDLFRCDMATARVKVPATGTGVIIPNTSTLNLYGIGAIVKAGAEIQRLADLVDKIHDKLYSILDHKLPIVGGKLGQALNTGQDAFNKISSYLSTNLNSLGSLTQITGVDVQNVIWAALGTPGLDILPASVVSAADIPIVLKSTDGNNSDAEEVYLNHKAAKGNADVAAAMNALVKDPNDVQAIAQVSAQDPSWNATMRTTCVATMLDAGHATNALPQRARANINCRIFPGVAGETVRAKLQELVADPQVKVTMLEVRGPSSAPPPLTPKILAPFEKLTAQYFPGVPVLPVLQAGATDGQFLNGIGIPTYGIEPVFLGPDLGSIHGLNEYVGVKSLLDGRAFLYDLVKVYATQK